ncbi:N-acetylmuramoyl-L-alanine amidase, partial [Lentibacillus halodurans]
VVEDFQAAHGLTVDGIAGTNTLSAIEEALKDNPQYQEGDSGDHIVSLKEDLTSLGFANWSSPTEYYGSITVDVVKDFQSYYGLDETGVADKKTRNKISEVLNPPYKDGDRGEQIIELKKALVALGFSSWSDPSQYYGKITSDVVKEFQEAYGLETTGIVDKATLKTLDNNVVKIFLDPGHGAHDSGAQGYGLNEKDVVRDIALDAVSSLESKYSGAIVNTSRTKDTFVELEDRAQMANAWDADYFVSIHNNAFDGSGHGFESYIHDGNVTVNTKEKQRQIHQYIASELSIRNGIRDRGMKEANFNVLRNTTMPAILLELLFIDNFAENTLLQDPSYRAYIGEVIADAIANSFDLERS